MKMLKELVMYGAEYNLYWIYTKNEKFLLNNLKIITDLYGLEALLVTFQDKKKL